MLLTALPNSNVFVECDVVFMRIILAIRIKNNFKLEFKIFESNGKLRSKVQVWNFLCCNRVYLFIFRQTREEVVRSKGVQEIAQIKGTKKFFTDVFF